MYFVLKNLISIGRDCMVGERFQTSDSFNVVDVPYQDVRRYRQREPVPATYFPYYRKYPGE
jgi:hypothetical protein